MSDSIDAFARATLGGARNVADETVFSRASW
jgi:hypothetical protein